MISSLNNIYVAMSKIPFSGRGVFATHEIQKGEIIETCPFIEIPNEEIESIENSVFINYVYFFGNEKDRMLLALGFGSIYNHKYSPNAMYKIVANKKVIEFSAIKDIKKNDEITVNYNQESPNAKPLWFE